MNTNIRVMRALLISALISATIILQAIAGNLADGVAIATKSIVQVTVVRRPISNDQASNALPRKSNQDIPIMTSQSGTFNTGSGVILSSDGYIYTADYLLDDGASITVWTPDRHQFSARLIGKDRYKGLALIKIEANGLTPAAIRSPSKIRLGEQVFSAGVLPESLGVNPVVTDGIISAFGHSEDANNFPLIQTTSALTPGMGGGGLFNSDGELIGISSMVYVNHKIPQSLSFSIPIDDAMEILPLLKQYGHVPRSGIGLQISDVSTDIAQILGLDKPAGALVHIVEANSPASKADIRAGDIILQVGSQPIIKAADLPRAFGKIMPGTIVPIKLWRKGKMMEVSATTRDIRANQ